MNSPLTKELIVEYGQVKVEGKVVYLAVNNKHDDMYWLDVPVHTSCYAAAIDDSETGTLDITNYCFYLDNFTEDYTGEIRYIVT